MQNNCLYLTVLIVLLSCNNNKIEDKNTVQPVTPGLKNHSSSGSLSFKMDGELFTADNDRVKAWTTSQTPVAMLMARNATGLSVSMQIYNIDGEGNYKLDGDNKGSVNFTVNGRTYWTRSVTGDNFLDVNVTNTKTQSTAILLSGTFEGVLEDNTGKKVTITEGKFTTASL